MPVVTDSVPVGFAYAQQAPGMWPRVGERPNYGFEGYGLSPFQAIGADGMAEKIWIDWGGR